jgi:hypothetical protein
MPSYWPYVTLTVSTGFAVFTAARVVDLRARQIVGQLRKRGEPTDIAEITTTITFYVAVVFAVAIVVGVAASNPNVDPRRAREATYIAPIVCAVLLAVVFAFFRAKEPKLDAIPGRFVRAVQGVIRFSRKPWPAAVIALFGIYSVLDTLARGLGVLLAR